MKVQLLSHSSTDHESISLFRKAVDTFGSGLPASEDIDCYALQTVVCNAFEEFPGRNGMAIQLRGPRSLLHPKFPRISWSQIIVSSDGETFCALEPFKLTSLTYEAPRGRKFVHAFVQISIRGTPKQQVSRRIKAREQMDIMRQVLASKCRADFDGYVIGHPSTLR